METKRPTYLGADLGGTKLMIGESDADGGLLWKREYPSGYLAQSEALKLIERVLDEVLEGRPTSKRPAAIGLGLIGRVDSSTGNWLEIDRDRAETLPIAEILEGKYTLPCFADNDVRSAAKAEMLFGQGKEAKNWIYLNVGTGIAASVVSNGKLMTGGHWNAGEVGHSASGIAFHAPCSCGRPDCVEPVASGMGLDLCARLLVAQYPGTKLKIPPEGMQIGAAEIFSLYETDPLCRVLTDNAAQALANLIMNLVRFCDPELIVLGGGIMSTDFLYLKIIERLNPYTVRYVTGGIVRTGLDPRNIGLLGACGSAIKGLEET